MSVIEILNKCEIAHEIKDDELPTKTDVTEL